MSSIDVLVELLFMRQLLVQKKIKKKKKIIFKIFFFFFFEDCKFRKSKISEEMMMYIREFEKEN